MSPATILVGDVSERLRELSHCSVQTCVTSPPYWGLRDYQHESQMGLERTPDEYVEQMVAVFREVRRVLADDGTVWLNLGDSYNSNKTTHAAKHIKRPQPDDLKPKDLVGIPWRVAFALQADGWYLRQDIIWAKPNPMPEPVRDRCTKAHEYIFLLTKSARYLYNANAVREAPATYSRKGGTATYTAGGSTTNGVGSNSLHQMSLMGRNRLSVWTVPTKPFRGAHFAVMPEALAERCVLAGSGPGDTVLDPFAGSGTVAVVALRHARNFVGVELNPEYSEIARQRIEADSPMFNRVEVLP